MPTRYRVSLVIVVVSALTLFSHFLRDIYDDTSIESKCATPNWLESKATISDLNIEKVASDDSKLIELLRKHYIGVPDMASYNLTSPEIENRSPGQTQFVDTQLKHKRNGFFIDCGAYDGEHLSNSLFLERYRNWTGILIEPNPIIFERLRRKHRKSYSLNACLSVKPYPLLETFNLGRKPVLGRIVKPSAKVNNVTTIHVQCFPIYSVLLALKTLHVDYFSLDVEGAELGVLETIPWNKVDITFFSIEHNKWPGGKQNLTTYMNSKGYDFMTEIKVNVAPDLIFMKKKKQFMNFVE